MLLESTVRDLLYSFRVLLRNVALTTATILTLSLSTAGLSTVFTLGYGLLYRDLPVPQPDGLVFVSSTRQQGADLGYVSIADYTHFRDHMRSVSELAAFYSGAPLFVRTHDRSKQLNGGVISANYFSVLGITPHLGRFFREDEDRVPERDRVAVLGFELWRQWFGGSREAIGATVIINDAAFTIIGVAPPEFRGLYARSDEIYIPAMTLQTGYRACKDAFAPDCTILEMIGRIAPGRSVADVRAEAQSVRPDRWPLTGSGNTGATALTRREMLATNLERVRLITLLVGVAAVLLLVCAVNLIGLQIARNTARIRELAIRAALGAGRARLVRWLLGESFWLGLAGAVLGLVISRVLVAALDRMFYAGDASGGTLHYDFTPASAVVAAVFASAFLTALLVGAASAAHTIRHVNADLVRRAAPAWTGARLGRWLVATQVALAVALVTVGALLMAGARAFVHGTAYDSSKVVIVRLRPPLLGYEPERAQRYMRRVLERVQALPAVESATLFTRVTKTNVRRSTETGAPTVAAEVQEIGTRYFETLGAGLMRGREFTDADRVGAAPVAVVDDTLARRLWPDGDAVGATIVVMNVAREVVGVVPNLTVATRAQQPSPIVYLPFWQNPAQVDARAYVRVTLDAGAMLPTITAAVSAIDPAVPISETVTLAAQRASLAASGRLSAVVVGYAAAMALVLTIVGLYGILTFTVTQRTREIGVRMALGAQRAGVLVMILRAGLVVILCGSMAGVAAAVAATRLFDAVLYGAPAADWRFYPQAIALVAVIGLLACLMPAHRAARIDPLSALKHE
jgi:putative ABC transport system permease protein